MRRRVRERAERARARGLVLADRLLRAGLERLHDTGPVLVPEFRLDTRARWGWNGRPSAPLASILAARDPEYAEAVAGVCGLLDWARSIPADSGAAGGPCWENSYWGTLDALMQCWALRTRNPALYLEVGSGYSTTFARRAIDDFGLRTRIVSIDPRPRADVDRLCDEVVRAGLQDADPGLFDRLGPGDMLLVDGSHVALMNSDATVFFLDLLPRIAPGVLVGIDDVFLPWDYPPQWTGRGYGEQYLLGAFLLGGAEQWRVRFPGWWLVECSRHAPRFEELWPVVENRFGRHAGSFWLERAAE
jgi:hypothetical protein